MTSTIKVVKLYSLFEKIPVEQHILQSALYAEANAKLQQVPAGDNLDTDSLWADYIDLYHAEPVSDFDQTQHELRWLSLKNETLWLSLASRLGQRAGPGTDIYHDTQRTIIYDAFNYCAKMPQNHVKVAVSALARVDAYENAVGMQDRFKPRGNSDWAAAILAMSEVIASSNSEESLTASVEFTEAVPGWLERAQQDSQSKQVCFSPDHIANTAANFFVRAYRSDPNTAKELLDSSEEKTSVLHYIQALQTLEAPVPDELYAQATELAAGKQLEITQLVTRVLMGGGKYDKVLALPTPEDIRFAYEYKRTIQKAMVLDAVAQGELGRAHALTCENRQLGRYLIEALIDRGDIDDLHRYHPWDHAMHDRLNDEVKLHVMHGNIEAAKQAVEDITHRFEEHQYHILAKELVENGNPDTYSIDDLSAFCLQAFLLDDPENSETVGLKYAKVFSHLVDSRRYDEADLFYNNMMRDVSPTAESLTYLRQLISNDQSQLLAAQGNFAEALHGEHLLNPYDSHHRPATLLLVSGGLHRQLYNRGFRNVNDV